MTWSKFDDGSRKHPKAVVAGNEAWSFWCAAVMYSNQYGTDGFIPDGALATELLPVPISKSKAKALAEKLCAARVHPDGAALFQRDQPRGGYLVHDFLDWNPSKREVDEKRRSDRERKKRGAPSPGTQACAYCGSPAGTWDHVTPLSHGGSDDPSNLVPACNQCNARKGARTPDQAGMPIRFLRDGRRIPSEVLPDSARNPTGGSEESAPRARTHAPPRGRPAQPDPPDQPDPTRPTNTRPPAEPVTAVVVVADSSDEDPGRETMCPTDLVERLESNGTVRLLAERLAAPIESVRACLRGFEAYWTIGKGGGHRRTGWAGKARQWVIEQAHKPGGLPAPGAVQHAAQTGRGEGGSTASLSPAEMARIANIGRAAR